jgi:sulfate transport system permease protein
VARPRPRLAGAAASTALSLGFVTAFLTVVALLPIAALAWESRREGAEGFWAAVSNPEAVAALELSLGAALGVTCVNAVLGTLTAWVLVRDRFRGQAVVNALIDLPFALPTIVAGLTLVALYGPRSPLGGWADVTGTRVAIGLALLFVTLPFVVRTVQPMLLELDPEVEEAARSLGAREPTVFRRVLLPAILPGILSGAALAFARAVGEIGSVVLVSGNLPFRTEVASVFILNHVQSGDATGAAAVAVLLLALSFAVLLVVGAIRRLATRHERA